MDDPLFEIISSLYIAHESPAVNLIIPIAQHVCIGFLNLQKYGSTVD